MRTDLSLQASTSVEPPYASLHTSLIQISNILSKTFSQIDPRLTPTMSYWDSGLLPTSSTVKSQGWHGSGPSCLCSGKIQIVGNIFINILIQHIYMNTSMSHKI